MAVRRPLAGIKVLDLTRVLAGPTASRSTMPELRSSISVAAPCIAEKSRKRIATNRATRVAVIMDSNVCT